MGKVLGDQRFINSVGNQNMKANPLKLLMRV